MKVHRISLVLAMVLTLGAAAGTAFAAGTSSTSTAPPPPPMAGPTGICADENNLYVVADGKIMQFQVTDLSLVATINLPKPPVPEGAPPKLSSEDLTSGQMPPHPPRGGGPHGVWASDGMLYILAGPAVLRYSIPDLILQTPVDLPKPVPPTVSN